MKIAVASKDGISINLHFGHAKVFMIYELRQGQCYFLEKRKVENYCLGNSSNPTALEMILDTINDCELCFIAKIGEGPAEKLAKIGVKAVDSYAYEEIMEALQEYAQILDSA